MKKNILLAVMFLFLTGCATPSDVSVNQGIQPTVINLSSTDKPAALNQSEIPAGSNPGKSTDGADSVASPAEPVGSPTPDLRLKPEEWMEWPVVPSLSPAMREVYRKGQKNGNLPNAFSKVGDCQNICEAFLCLYDQPGGYKLSNPFTLGYPQPEYHTSGTDFSYLQDTIDAFSGSWGREGMAVQGGFNFPAIYSPLRADPAQCKPGETPLVCEVRLHKPSFIIIGMEYWYKGRTAENFENYLRKTVAYALERGIVPIVEAKADNMEGDHSINLAAARVAYEYDLPFWNFWGAVQEMPDKGMDTRRDHEDGFHISYDAQLVRSFSALQTLDSLRRSIDGPIALASATLSTPTETPVAVKSASEPAAPLDLKGTCPDSGRGVIFSVLQSEVSGITPQGITLFDPITSAWTQISDKPYTLLGVSPRGCRILLADGPNLYTVALDASEPILLSDRYNSASERGALWLAGRNEIAYLATGEDDLPALFLVKPDGSGLTNLPTDDLHPMELYPSPDARYLYWESGKCTPVDGKCVSTGARVTDLNGEGYPVKALGEEIVPNGSPQVGLYAFIGKNKKGEPRLMLGSLDGKEPRSLEVSATQHAYEFYPPTHLLQYAWSPDGKRLSVIGTNRSTYSGKQLDDRYFIISADNKNHSILPQKLGKGLLTSAWSPDGKTILFAGALESSEGVRIILKSYDRITHRVSSLDSPDLREVPGDAFLYVADLYWFSQRTGSPTP